ncbi:shikimate dehydrogenase [Methylophaga sp.]|uniref:shikimate dehydrogenase n=1 Tax=Methylophaga sp. TaxID=2024840 RepID=UPI002723FF34|nr:shikimate dehydrogenase [Methylophaga sp.]MDO8826352.1 shikimate dehydrogenase [Methylophaga sp.]
MTDKYAVIGNPIRHSKSPLIHAEFAKQTGENIEYTAIEVPLESLQTSLQQLRNILKIKGVNVTVPFKEQVWAMADKRSVRAELAGAVNTIVFHDDGSLFGDNTDGIGLCRDLTINHQVELAGKRILLLGAGGASRGVIAPLLEYQPANIFIANRTAEKASYLAQLFDKAGTVKGGGFNDIQGEFDVVINATAASLQGEVPPLPDTVLASGSCCYDMMYSDTDTTFIQWAKAHNAAKTIDGLGMLVEQAAEAFFIWRGIRPQTTPVISMLRAEFRDDIHKRISS